MEIGQVVALGVIATIIILVIKEYRPDLARQLSIAAGIIILLFLLDYLRTVLNVITEVILRADMNIFFLQILFRIVGVAYIAEFGAQVCRDAGENTIASKIELAGKIFILALAIPIIISVMETILNFVP
ncbi:MAG: stage III sporulation protein AD [Firmicutes bacterium]|nr:stage III sporulation protein AD [Bacillota bacterium]